MSVSTILKEKGADVVSVKPDDSVLAVAQLLSQRRIGAVLVRDADGRICGILSERDIVHALANHSEGALHRTAGALMTREIVYGHPEDTAEQLMTVMTERRIRHVPIRDGQERLVGMVSIGDVVKQRIALAEQEVESMRAYLTGNA